MGTQLKKHERTFIIDDMIGESTGELYKGTFTIKTLLSYGDLLRLDRLRRDLLGGNHQEAASEMALNISNSLADLTVRIVEGPSWWTDSNYGLNFIDNNVTQAIYDQMIKCVNEENSIVTKKKEEAIAKLRSFAPPPDAA